MSGNRFVPALFFKGVVLEFPHMKDSTFPNLGNVNVYKYANEFDYSRYDKTQMQLCMCTVPWDMGEAHIGNRTISGIGNVVFFETEDARDAWFAAIPDDKCYRFETKYKELHREKTLDIEVPFDVCARYNYITVTYSLFANDDSPVKFEDDSGLKRWFWFIREVEFVSPNTTRLHLMLDAWQTFIYDFDVTGMVLERGHAPLFANDVDNYLRNPIDNCADLLTEDVSYGEIRQVKSIDALELNKGDMYACIATTANPRGNWGLKSDDTWNTPASQHYTVNGVPSVFVFALPAGYLNTFLEEVNSTAPQFRQTIQAVFFLAQNLVTVQETFQFCGRTCYTLASTRQELPLMQEITKSMFGYETRYAELAKLYTEPYAHIEVTDEKGNVDIIRIEDTDGRIDVSLAVSLAYPIIRLDAHLLGVGGSASANLVFRNITSSTMGIAGRWYETLKSWDVPTFAVVLGAAREYDYSTYFDRLQRENDLTTTYNNATRSIDNTKTNADASANQAYTNAERSAAASRDNSYKSASTGQTNTKQSAIVAEGNAKRSNQAVYSNTTGSAATAKTNADNNAQTIINNTLIQTTANSSITTRSNQASLTDKDYANGLAQALQAWEAGYARETVNNEVNAAYASAAIGAAGGAINAAASGAMSGAALGPAGAAAGAVGGLISGAISGVTTAAQTAVAANLKSTQAEATIELMQEKVDETKGNNTDRTTNQNSANTANTTTANTASSGVAANTASTMSTNATNTKSREDANALNTKTAGDTNAEKTKKVTDDNADRSKIAADANALRTYNAANNNALGNKTLALETINPNNKTTDDANAKAVRDNERIDIQNDIKQAALRAPFVYGEFANGNTATTRPMALIANVVTQDKHAIASAGDMFLRYGYMYDRQWSFNGNWNIGKHFTYWKLKDFWVKNLNVPDMYADSLRFFLFGGVTVWRAPEEIGNVGIYDNWPD